MEDKTGFITQIVTFYASDPDTLEPLSVKFLEDLEERVNHFCYQLAGIGFVTELKQLGARDGICLTINIPVDNFNAYVMLDKKRKAEDE